MYIHVLFSFFRKVAEAVAVCDRMGLLWPTEYTTTYIMTTLFSAQGCEKGRSLDFYDERKKFHVALTKLRKHKLTRHGAVLHYPDGPEQLKQSHPEIYADIYTEGGPRAPCECPLDSRAINLAAASLPTRNTHFSIAQASLCNMGARRHFGKIAKHVGGFQDQMLGLAFRNLNPGGVTAYVNNFHPEDIPMTYYAPGCGPRDPGSSMYGQFPPLADQSRDMRIPPTLPFADQSRGMRIPPTGPQIPPTASENIGMVPPPGPSAEETASGNAGTTVTPKSVDEMTEALMGKMPLQKKKVQTKGKGGKSTKTPKTTGKSTNTPKTTGKAAVKKVAEKPEPRKNSKLPFPGVPKKSMPAQSVGNFQIYTDVKKHAWRVKELGVREDTCCSWKRDPQMGWNKVLATVGM